MPVFDLRAILLMSAVMPGLMALVMFALRRSLPRSIRGVANWAQGAMLVSVGAVLLSLRGGIPDLASVIGGNLCMIGAMGIWLIGTQRFFGRPPSWRLVLLLLLIDGVGLSWLTWMLPTAAGRALCTNLLLLFLYSRLSWQMLRDGRGDGSAFFLGTMFLVQAIATGARIATAFHGSTPTPGLYASDLVQVVYLGVSAIMSLVVTVGFMLVAMNRLRAQLERLSRLDPLTGLANRRAFLAAYADAEQTATHDADVLALVLIDIDHFKGINDTYGHAKGDEILVDFSVRAAALLPDDAHLTRWGGEEFSALLRVDHPQDAMDLADRLRAHIAVHDPDGLPRYTCSIGVAFRTGPETSIERLMKEADQGLYRAKRAGRNRVASVSESVPSKTAEDLEREAAA